MDRHTHTPSGFRDVWEQNWLLVVAARFAMLLLPSLVLFVKKTQCFQFYKGPNVNANDIRCEIQVEALVSRLGQARGFD
jgi:hypothetical protein